MTVKASRPKRAYKRRSSVHSDNHSNPIIPRRASLACDGPNGANNGPPVRIVGPGARRASLVYIERSASPAGSTSSQGSQTGNTVATTASSTASTGSSNNPASNGRRVSGSGSIGNSLGDNRSYSNNHQDSEDEDSMEDDEPPRPGPRRRSTVDAAPQEMLMMHAQRRRSSMEHDGNNANLAGSGHGNSNGGGAPRFRPPTSGDSEPLGNHSAHSLNGGGMSKRASMSDLEQMERRASIKQIMRDGRLSAIEKRRSIQFLMDGRKRATIDCGSANPYLAAREAAAAKLRRESVRRSSSFDNGPGENSEGTANGEASASTNSIPRRADGSFNRMESITSLGRGDDEHNDDGDAMMADADEGVAAAAIAASPFASAMAASSAAPSQAAAPFQTSSAPWASFNAGSHEDSGVAMDDVSGGSSSFGGSLGSNHSFNPNNPNGFDPNGMQYDANGFPQGDIEVPNHDPMTVAAIAHAAAQTRSEQLEEKHPYGSNTAVPAVAAGASETFPFRPQKRRPSVTADFARRAIETAPPCTHYQRNCHIVSPCCGATFGCRICHDDCPVLPPQVAQNNMREFAGTTPSAEGGFNNGGRRYQRVQRTSSMPTSFSAAPGPPEHHNIDRFAIKEVICRECFTKQSSKTNFCVNCNVKFGEYHCAICNLWMSDEERPYHCPDCGFCRVGGGENFRHCDDCGMCIDRQLFADHNCKVGKYMSNCPVCQEDLFSSRDASHELPCGHAIHWHCFRELASHDSRCPMCKKTAETHERMKPTWDAMAMGIALQPVPPELCKVVTIKCNDCEDVQQDRAWHFLGVQCRKCESFNTVVERITMMGREAHEHLLRENPPPAGPPAPMMPMGGNAGGGQQAGQGGGQERMPQFNGGSSPTPRARRRRRATVQTESAPMPPPPFG